MTNYFAIRAVLMEGRFLSQFPDFFSRNFYYFHIFQFLFPNGMRRLPNILPSVNFQILEMLPAFSCFSCFLGKKKRGKFGKKNCSLYVEECCTQFSATTSVDRSEAGGNSQEAFNILRNRYAGRSEARVRSLLVEMQSCTVQRGEDPDVRPFR